MHRSLLSDGHRLKNEQPDAFCFLLFKKNKNKIKSMTDTEDKSRDKQDSLDFFVESINSTNTKQRKSKLCFVFMFSWMSKPSKKKTHQFKYMLLPPRQQFSRYNEFPRKKKKEDVIKAHSLCKEPRIILHFSHDKLSLQKLLKHLLVQRCSFKAS